MRENLYEAMEDIFENLLRDNMKAIIYTDNSIYYTSSDTSIKLTKDILKVIPLDYYYRSDTLSKWNLLDKKDNLITNNKELKEEFIKEILMIGI